MSHSALLGLRSGVIMDDYSATGVTPLTGELSDGICEAVLVSPHPRGRSDTICNIVQVICETIGWLNRSKPTTIRSWPACIKRSKKRRPTNNA